MKNQTRTFLEFHGRSIYLSAHDGQYWVALKPVCEALGVDWNRQFQNLKDDPFFVGVFAKQQMHDSSNRLQEMVCLPEKWVYGWLLSIRSDSPDLLAYKRECYEVLFDYFHGPMAQRIQTLRQKTQAQLAVERLQAELEESDIYQQLVQARAAVIQSGRQLSRLDQDIESGQLTLWQQEVFPTPDTPKPVKDRLARQGLTRKRN